MKTRLFSLALLALVVCAGASASEGPLVDSMDEETFALPDRMGRLNIVEGIPGKAIKFTFANGCTDAFFRGRARGTPEWDAAAGFSFWVKGDGSDHLGGLQLIWDAKATVRYTCAFPIDSTEWKKIVVAWRDLIPVLPHPDSRPLDPKTGNAASKLGHLWFGKWYFWKDYAAHSYVIDDIRLEPTIERDTRDFKPDGQPLARVLAKVKAKQAITIVTMGDSLTDNVHLANKEANWPTILKSRLKEKYGVDATIVNPAVSGSLLRQGLVIMPHWLKQAPEPDLVTCCYGLSDLESGMTPELFLDANVDAADRIRRATKGKADVLIMTPCPPLCKWDAMAGLADACRKAAAEKNAGIADTYKAFHEVGEENRERLFSKDTVHMDAAGHELIARVVMEAIGAGGK